MSHEQFNLDRHLSIENNVDAMGRKWEIKRVNRESSLLVGVPNPFRQDFICPKEFEGMWTSAEKLSAQINLYLNKSWDLAEKRTRKQELKTHADKVEKQEQKSDQEALEALPQEMKDVLGDTIALKEPEAPAPKKKATQKKTSK